MTKWEILAVLEYPNLRIPLIGRRPGDVLWLFVGRAGANEPHIEVIADVRDPDHTVVFHAMFLRRELVRRLALDRWISPDFAAQRK